MPGDRAKNQIDYICISQSYRNELFSTKTYPGADCGTDHVPAVATLRIKLKKLKKPQGKENFDRGLLSSKNEFTEKNQKFVEQDSEEILTIEEPLSLFKTFSGTITKALKEYIPMKQNKKEQKTWITEDIKELFDKRRRAKGTKEYPLIDKRVKKKCNEEYTKFLEKTAEIEERLFVIPTEVHKRIKELSGTQRNSRRTSMIKDDNGLLLLESSEVKERWQQYTKKLYDDPNRSESMPFLFEEPLTGLPILKDEI